MKQLLTERPYQAIWLAIPVILLLSTLGAQATFDLQLHDTYYVLAPLHVGLATCLFCVLTGGLYWLSRHKKLITWMTLLHLLLTFSGMLAVVMAMLLPDMPSMDRPQYQFIQQLFAVVMLTWMFAQLLFAANIIIGFSRKQKK